MVKLSQIHLRPPPSYANRLVPRTPPPHPPEIFFDNNREKIKSGFILSVYTLRFPSLKAFPVLKFGYSMNEQKITDGV